VTDLDNSALLVEALAKLRAVETQLQEMTAAQAEAQTRCAAANTAYRESLDHHRRSLDEMAAAQAEAHKTYAAADTAYRESLDRYKRSFDEWSKFRMAQTILRLVGLVLLAYIAYQVSS
jgi:DNA-binding protein H-NS